MALPDEAAAQSITIDIRKAPLREALDYLSLKSGVDFVYSVRLIEENTATCHYEGESFEEALRCVLVDTNVRSISLHAKQYVLAPAIEGGAGLAGSSASRQNNLALGRIVDRQTGAPLPGAHIYLIDEQRGATSRSDGTFTLTHLQRGDHRVRVSYLGYLPVDTTLAAPGSRALLALNPVALETDGLLVEAPAPSRRDELPIPGVLAISIQDIEAMPAFNSENDLFNTLQWTPGVRKEGGINTGLLVRGGAPDQNLYLLDGAPVYHPWHAFNLVSTFQSDTFKDIKLYRGAFPAQHGGRLSSILDANLKDGSRTQPQARVALSALSGRFLFESPLTRRSSFMVSGRRSYLDKLIGREHPVEDRSGVRDTLRTGYYFSDFTAKLAYKPGNEHRLSFTYYAGRDVLDLRLPFDLSLDFSSWLRPADLYFEVDHSWGNRLYSFQHKYLVSRRLLLTTTAYRTSYNANEGALIRPTSNAIVDSYYHVRVRDLGVKVDGDYFASDAHHIQFGFQAIDHAFNSSIDARIQRTPSAIDTTSDASAVGAREQVTYLEDTWRPTSRLTLQPGVRLSRFSSRQRLYTSPRLSVEYVADPRWLVLRSAFGQQVQFMQRLRDRYSLIYDLVSSRWIPTDRSVRPSTGYQASLEGESHPFPWLMLAAETYIRHADRVLIPTDEFQTKDELIGPGIELGSLLAQYTQGKSRGYGMEFTAQARRGPWLFWVNYAGSRALIRESNGTLADYRPTDYDAPRLFRSTITRFFNTWNVTLSTTARSGYPLTVPVARYSLNGPTGEPPTAYLYRPEINNGRLPPYLRFDVTISNRFTLIGAQWKAQLHVFNITNRRNVIDRLYDPAQSIVVPRDLKGLPILPLFELEMEL
ncbi:MAG: TonB-dependent receptor [Rhodothermales bacterium]